MGCLWISVCFEFNGIQRYPPLYLFQKKTVVIMNATNITGNPLVSEVSSNVINYFGTLPQQVMQGNAVAIMISLLIFFVLILILNAISALLLSFMKRTILFLIIILVIYDFFPRYMELVKTQGWQFSTIIIGITAATASIFGFYIASRSFVMSAKAHLLKLADRIKQRQTPDAVVLEKERQIEQYKQQENIKEMFSKEALHNEKSLLSVLVYLIVAQFGVFSSPTLSSPNVQVGIMFFSIFIVGIIIFVKSSYKNLQTAVTYFGVTFIIGLLLSFALGILWGKNTLPELLSPNFFTSDSLVAMITGMGVSLFAGSKG